MRGEGQGLSRLPSVPLLVHQSAAQPGPLQAHPEQLLLGDPSRRGSLGTETWGHTWISAPLHPHVSLPSDYTRPQEPANTPTQIERPMPLNTKEPLVKPWVGLGLGWGGLTVCEGLAPQGVLGLISPVTISAQTAPWFFPVTCHTPPLPYHGPFSLGPLGACAPLPHPTVPGLPETGGQVGNAGPEAGSAPPLLIYVTRANVSLPRAQQVGRTELPQSVSSSILPSSCQYWITRPPLPSDSLPGRPFLSSGCQALLLAAPQAALGSGVPQAGI